jgi:hypothetical protein
MRYHVCTHPIGLPRGPCATNSSKTTDGRLVRALQLTRIEASEATFRLKENNRFKSWKLLSENNRRVPNMLKKKKKFARKWVNKFIHEEHEEHEEGESRKHETSKTKSGDLRTFFFVFSRFRVFVMKFCSLTSTSVA